MTYVALVKFGLGDRKIFPEPLLPAGSKRKANDELAGPPSKRRSLSPGADPPDIAASTTKIVNPAPPSSSSGASSSPSRVLPAETRTISPATASSTPANHLQSDTSPSHAGSSTLQAMSSQATLQADRPTVTAAQAPSHVQPPTIASAQAPLNIDPPRPLSATRTEFQFTLPPLPGKPAPPTIVPTLEQLVNTRLEPQTVYNMLVPQSIPGTMAGQPPAVVLQAYALRGEVHPMFARLAPRANYVSPYSSPYATRTPQPPVASQALNSADNSVAPSYTSAKAALPQSDSTQASQLSMQASYEVSQASELAAHSANHLPVLSQNPVMNQPVESSTQPLVSQYVQVSSYESGFAQPPLVSPHLISSQQASYAQQIVPTQSYVPNDSSLWTDVLAPQTTPQLPQPSASPASGSKPRKPRKRRSPPKQPQQAQEENEDTVMSVPIGSLGSARKRGVPETNPQEPTTHKRRRNHQHDVAANPSQAEHGVLPEGAAVLECIFNGTSGKLILLKNLATLQFIQNFQPITDTPMLALSISSITEYPIVSVPGSKPMELRIKANDNNAQNITYCFAFVPTGERVDPSEIISVLIRSAIVANEFGNGNDLPSVDEFLGVEHNENSASGDVPQTAGDANEFGDDDDLPPVDDLPGFGNLPRVENDDNTASGDAPQSAGHFQQVADAPQAADASQSAGDVQQSAENPKQAKKGEKAKKAKSYNCARCGNSYMQSWGLNYHLTKSNTPCNPNANLKLYAEKKARREKRIGSQRIKLSKEPTSPQGSDDESQDQQTPNSDPKNPQMQFQAASLKLESMKPKPKRGRPPKKSVEIVESESQASRPLEQSAPPVNAPQNPPSADSEKPQKKHGRPKKDAVARHEEAEQSDASTSTIDSAIEFFQTHNTTGVERPRKVSFADLPKNTSSNKKYKALPFEDFVLQEIAEQIAVAPASSNVLEPTAPIETATTSPNAAESSTSLEIPTSKASAGQCCEEILVSLIRNNGGFFPGDKAIWIAFAGIWFTKFPSPPVLPLSTLCSKSVDLLVENKKLCSTQFTWIDAKKREITRTILTSPKNKVTAAGVDTLKTLIQEAHPDIYLPSEYAPLEPMLTRLIALATRKVPVADRERFRLQKTAAVESDSESRSQSPVQVDDDSSGDEFVAGGIEEAEHPEDEVEDLGNWDEEEAELVDTETKPKKQPRRKGTKKGDKWSRQRSSRHNKAISEGVRRNWAAKKATQSKGFFPNRKVRTVRKPMTQEEKDRRAETAYYNKRSWDYQTPAFLPNPETGAWDFEAKPKKSRRGGRRLLKPKLPHPITWMQAPNGAWSQRPAGHGTKPVFARPSRRTDEEGTYLKRMHRDHRPVLFPTKNRKFLPANPSKKLLGQPLASERRDSGEISKRTGKPKRKYTRKGQPTTNLANSAGYRASKKIKKKKKKLRPDSYCFPVFVLGNAKERKTKKRDKKAVNEADILAFFEPKKLLPDAPRNVGLESIPPSFGLLASLYRGPDPEVHKYRPDYKNLLFVAPNIITGGEKPNHGSWTVGVWRPVTSGSITLRWEDATAIDMESLPFSKLDFGRDDDYQEDKKRGKPGRAPRRYTLIPVENITKEERFKYTRVLTAVPNDLKGLLKDQQDVTKELGVQVAKPNRAAQFNRRIKGSRAILSKKAETRLIVTVIVTRTLTGGIDGRIDWVIVSQLFQDYTCNFLTKYWNSLQIPKRDLIERILKDFRKFFPLAYKNKQVPSINYDHLPDYQWRKLVKWAMENKKIHTSMLVKKQKPLPSSRMQVKELFDIKPAPKDPRQKPWREPYHKEQTANYLRVQMATAEPRVVRPKKSLKALSHDEYRVLRSWVRAAATTAAEDYDPKVAQQKLLSMAKKPVIKEILAGLQEEKVLLKNSRVRRFFGGSFEVGSVFLTPLTKMDFYPEQLIDAVMAKLYLDGRFWQGNESVVHDELATPGCILAVTSMQAHRRIRLDSTKWPSEGRKFGVLQGGGYETRKIPPKNYNFDVILKPTASYVYDSDNAALDKFLQAEPPRGSAAGELPIWWGITGKLNRDLWKRTLAAVGSVIGNRAGINVTYLMEHFAPTFEEWELRILMNWGTEVGLFERVNPRIEGWTCSEWWWLMIGTKVNDGIALGRGK